MGNIIKVIKINMLSLTAFPLLLLSIASQLLAKALEKAIMILGALIAIGLLALLRVIIQNPGAIFEGMGYFIAGLLFFGAIIAIIVGIFFFFGSVALVAITFIITALSAILNAIFSLSNDWYSKLFDICKNDFEAVKNSNNNLKFACIFWYLLKTINFVFIKLLLFAYPISLLLSLAFAGYMCYYTYSSTHNTFGISIFEYLSLFPVINTIFAVLYFIVFIVASAIILISLGIEWSEWGKLLSYSSSNYSDYSDSKIFNTVDDLVGNEDISFEAGKASERCDRYMDVLHKLFEDIEVLEQFVQSALAISNDSSLHYSFTEYLTVMSEIQTKLNSFPNSISNRKFEITFIPLIDRAKRISDDLEKKSRVIHSKGTKLNQSGANFFDGCDTEEEIKSRFRALSKVYHPDVGGHTATFQIMQEQYGEKLKNI